MNRSVFITLLSRLILITLFIFRFNFVSIAASSITNPIPEPILKSNLAISLQEIVKIPDSGVGNSKAARLNFLTHAGDGSGRLFVNDMRGKLYVINNRQVTVYLDLKERIIKGFRNQQALEEIWAYGLRNPHRFYWDTEAEKKMLIVDIDQAFIEEINLGIKGANYGWGEREGTWVITEENENVLYPLPDNDSQFNYTYPVAQYDHDKPANIQGEYPVAIARGYVYRGQAIPELFGQYIFADFGRDARFFHVPVDELILGKQAAIKQLRILQNNQEISLLDLVNQQRSDVRLGVDETGEI